MPAALRRFTRRLPCVCMFLFVLFLAYAVNQQVRKRLQCHEPVQYRPAPPTARPDGSQPSRVEPSYVICKRSHSRYDISRELVQALEVVLTCANAAEQIAPVHEAGGFRGFRLSLPSSNPLYARLGLRDQDLLRGVNGRVLDGTELTPGLIDRLRDPPSRLDLELERDGKRVHRIYLLK